jgi:hypothetical protein
MSPTRKYLTLLDSLPAAARKLFMHFPVAAGEDQHQYQERLAEVFAAIQPKDSIEAFWAKDILDLTLEIERLRQIEAGLLEAKAREADHVNDVMEQHLAKVAANFAMVKWAQDRGVDHRVETPEMKAQWGKFYEEQLSQRIERSVPRNSPADPNDLAQAFLHHGAELDRIGRMIATAEARRRSVLRELEQYRAARRPAAGKAGIIDAAFTEPAGSQ